MNVDVQFEFEPKTDRVRALVFGCLTGRRATVAENGDILSPQTGDLVVDTVAGALSEWFQADFRDFGGLNAHKIRAALKRNRR
jgi:hypothetical protein